MAVTVPPSWARFLIAICTAAGAAVVSACVERTESQPAPSTPAERRIELTACRPAGTREDMRCGTAIVHENPARRDARELRLSVVVVPARSAAPRAEPIFFLMGGPGQTATDAAAAMERSP